MHRLGSPESAEGLLEMSNRTSEREEIRLMLKLSAQVLHEFRFLSTGAVNFFSLLSSTHQ